MSQPTLSPEEQEQQAVPRKRRNIVPRLAAFAVLAAGAAWLTHFCYESITYEKTDDAYLTAHIHRISPGVGGPVLKVLVEENQRVKTGQELAEIDPLEFEIARQKLSAAKVQAEAGVCQATAAQERAKAEELQATAQVANAEAAVKLAEAQLELANTNYQRNASLSNGGTRAIAAAELDTSRSVVATSSANLEGAKAALAAAEAKRRTSAAAIDVADAEIRVAKANSEAQAAALREAERQYADTRIVAPADGLIGNRSIETGNRVQNGQPVFALVEDGYWIVANFKETQLKSMKPGQPVEIAVDALGGKTFQGHIDSISPSTGAQFALLPPDNATGNFTKVVQRVPVKIVFEGDSLKGFEDSLRPGLSTVVKVRVKG